MFDIKKVAPGQLKTTNIKMFIYGKSFLGKTTFASTFPGEVLILSTDGNYKTLDKEVYAIDIKNEDEKTLTSGQVVKQSGWLAFKELVRMLKTKEFDSIKTIVVDLIKDVYDLGRLFALNQEGVKHESEIKAQGKSWTLIDQEITPVLRDIMTLDKNVVIIANETERDGFFIPDTISSFTTKIMKYSDITGRLWKPKPKIGQPDNGVPLLSCTSTYASEGGNRFNIGQIEIEQPTYDKLLEIINKGK